MKYFDSIEGILNVSYRWGHNRARSGVITNPAASPFVFRDKKLVSMILVELTTFMRSQESSEASLVLSLQLSINKNPCDNKIFHPNPVEGRDFGGQTGIQISVKFVSKGIEMLFGLIVGPYCIHSMASRVNNSRKISISSSFLNNG